jgi:hypothetical protein
MNINSTALTFYENYTLYHLLTKDFEGFYSKYNILRRFYVEIWEDSAQKGIVTQKSVKIVILVLLYLNINNKVKEFEESYQSLVPEMKEYPEMKKMEKFIEFVSIGNYNNAIELYTDATIEFKIIIDTMMDLKRYEYFF